MRKVFATLVLLATVTTTARAQDCGPVPTPGETCIAVDLHTMSAAMGYITGNISGLGTTPNRVMSGATFHWDIHLLSLALERVRVVRVYDALYVDAGLGSMSSQPLNNGIGPESKSAFPFGFGYHLLGGKQLSHVALMGGLGWQEQNFQVGDTQLNVTAHPIIARAEVGRSKHAVVTASAGSGTSGLRVDVPFFRRLNLTASYSSLSGTADVAGTSKHSAKSSTVMFGVRTLEVR